MNLNDLAVSHLGVDNGNTLRDTPTGQRLYERVQSESYTEPLLASLFWQIITLSPIFAQALQRVGASVSAFTQSERFVICHGPDWNARYDLLVLDPHFDRDQPSSVLMNEMISNNDDTLTDSFSLWRENQRNGLAFGTTPYQEDIPARWQLPGDVAGRTVDALRLIDRNFVIESAQQKPFGILVARPPTVQPTAVSSPALGVAQIGGPTTSTAGAMVKNAQGMGVTVALHDITSGSSVVSVGHTQISVEGIPGIVRSIDPITDSAFLSLPGVFFSNRVPLGTGRMGPLSGVSPRANEQATFEGISSGRKTVTVTGWSPDLPFVKPYNQLKVLTTADTNPGDSGAAIVDANDHILGFAFYRTGLGQSIEFSAWVWADSVFAAHGLSII